MQTSFKRGERLWSRGHQPLCNWELLGYRL